MDNPWIDWYLKVYELSAEFWLNALTTTGRYPPPRDTQRNA